MSFSLPRFLRRTPASSLEAYVAARGLSRFWKTKPKALLGNLQKAIDELGEPERENVFGDFERVDQLCDEVGQSALQEALAYDPAPISRARSCDGDEARGLLVLLKDRPAPPAAIYFYEPDRRGERPAAHLTLGRNYLFAGSDGGGARWATISSLIETAKLNSVEPYAYLRDVLQKMIGRHPINRLDELLPWAREAE